MLWLTEQQSESSVFSLPELIDGLLLAVSMAVGCPSAEQGPAGSQQSIRPGVLEAAQQKPQ